MQGECDKIKRSLAFGGVKMLRKMDRDGRFKNFLLPLDGKLKKDNRWVKLADINKYYYILDQFGISLNIL